MEANKMNKINWIEYSKRLADNFVNSFDNCEIKQYGKLWGFALYNNNVIITHPLWNWSSNQPCEESNLFIEAISDAGIENTYFIDSFNLHRRPGWCYGELIKKITDD